MLESVLLLKNLETKKNRGLNILNSNGNHFFYGRVSINFFLITNTKQLPVGPQVFLLKGQQKVPQRYRYQ